ncbi:MAG: hypothetical protein M3Z75_29580 [Actinomycetota bacterium]|nr:hypothetical protein [Actinomycetota bacterium]
MRFAQPDDPSWMGTLMTCVFVHPVPPGGSCQMISVVPRAARAAACHEIAMGIAMSYMLIVML